MEPLRKAERIAALLDGHLDERERAALLAELGASDDDLELLLDSAAITRELEEEDAAAGAPVTHEPAAVVTAEPRRTEVIPITAAPSARRRARWWSDPRAVAAAAVLLLAIGSSFWLARPRTPRSPVEALPVSMRTLPAGWTHLWAQTRGGDESISTSGTAFRFGVLVTDLEIAARAGDDPAADSAAHSVEDLFQQTNRGILAEDYRQMRIPPVAPTLTRVRRQAAKTALGLEPGVVALGRWTEAARLAASVGAAEFFHSEESRGYAQGHVPSGLTEAGRVALGRVRDALGKRGAPDWPGLRQALDDLLEEAS
ncbi:MAG: hypothetical protein JO306_14075 [Gemmatimonadetes bacterium]|nr:hypothetical protein [Gemmatimonadota bacterium]